MDRTNKLQVMTIQVYKDQAFESKAGDPFKVQFNPQSLTRNWNNNIAEDNANATAGNKGKWISSAPERMNFTLFFDNTGAADPGLYPLKKNNVFLEVEDFVKKTLTVQGDTHEPNFLRIHWGSFYFNCRLVSVHATYTRFNAAGIPVNATLSITLNGVSIDPPGTKDRNSPDLTHHRLVTTEQTLPQLSKEIYETPNYYLELAKVNDLDHFRKLSPGSELFFPPIVAINP